MNQIKENIVKKCKRSVPLNGFPNIISA